MEAEKTKNPLSLAYGLMILFTGGLFFRPQEIFRQAQGVGILQLTGIGIILVLLLKHRHIEWYRFKHRILLWNYLYLAAVLMSIPFSLWPGGSVKYLHETLLKEIVIAFALIALVFGSRDLRGIILTIGLSGTVLAIITLISFVRGEVLIEGYRAALSEGVFSDPNDLAACFVFSLPLLYFGGLKISRKKVFFGCAAAVLISAILATQSRGGMLGLIAVLFAGWLLDAGKRGKNLLVLIGAAVLIAIIFPSNVERLESIFDRERDSAGSIQARITSLKSGIDSFLQNPLLGVGVACFEIAEGATHGNVGKWNAAHNMWIEVAAETGVFGLAGFVGCLFSILKSLARVRRSASNDLKVRSMAEGLLCSAVGFMVCGTFLSHSDSWNLFYLIGLTVALDSLWMKNSKEREMGGVSHGQGC